MFYLAAAILLSAPMQKTATVRVIHAVADRQFVAARVANASWPYLAYGQRSEYAQVETQRAVAVAEGVQGERFSNPEAVKLQPAFPHTVILAGMPSSTGKVLPIVLRDSTSGRPSLSVSQIRFVNALSEETSVSIKIDGKKLSGAPVLGPGQESQFVSYAPREYDLLVETSDGKRLYSLKWKPQGGVRYTAVVMGAAGQQGTRSPRLFFYDF
jgi:hypothetical protein